ncbi:MAG: Vi polysaccharide biosynthesis protein VipB/TviC [Deltaproteobacteria bacterium RBG_13_53_10]|nr:MAG: Vi polysaccharide biosynthesis protein VipB/TviC [Deltaproteobacteria bacterium RBG_13_53_10]
MATVLVTGGAGFIGSNLTETLLKQGHRVRVLDNFSTGRKENLIFEEKYPLLEIMEGDICDPGVCRKAMRGINTVFHEAAIPSVQQSVEDPFFSNSVNAGGTLNVLLAARDEGVKKVVYASSCAIYGDDPALPKKEEMSPSPLSPYALQKYVGEKYCQLFSQLYGLETLSLRYFNIFGPKQDPASVYSGVIARFISALLQGAAPIVYGDGKQSRDFTYVGNVVQANLLAMSAHRLHGEVINIGCGKRTSLNELLDVLKRIFGSQGSPIYQEARQGDVRHSVADIQKGRELLNFSPREDLEIGLNKTVDYFRGNAGKRGV